MPRQYRLMSADGHLEVPPERWIHRVPEKHRERAPHTVKLPDGGDALMIEGQPLLEANFLDLRAGRAAGTWQPFGLKVADAAGTGSAEQRVREQDQDGLDAEVLFAAMVAGPVFWRNIAHDEVYKAVIRGYNDWLGEEYCAVAPDRLIGMGVIPITNVEDAIAEMAHCKKLGLKGVLLGALPNAKGYPTPEDDRFWAAALDLDMLGAAGGIEAIATAFAIHHGILPPTINYETPDPDCDLDYVPNEARKAEVKAALCNCIGFGSKNSAIVLRKI